MSRPENKKMLGVLKKALRSPNPSAARLVQMFWEEFGEPPPAQLLDTYRRKLEQRYAAHSEASKILLVDSEERIRDLIVRRLSQKPYHNDILTAGNGKEAMQAILKNRVAVVITDLRLPVMDGFTLIDFIQNEHPSIPAVAMSAFLTPDIEKRLRKKGVFQVLAKPLDFEKLHETIEKALKAAARANVPAGISMKNFLILLRMERKSFMAEVKNPKGDRARVYVDQGALIEVACGKLKGEAAALSLLAWDLVEIRFKKMPEKKVKRNINQGFIPLLVKAARMDADQRQQESIAETQEKPDGRKGAGKAKAG